MSSKDNPYTVHGFALSVRNKLRYRAAQSRAKAAQLKREGKHDEAGLERIVAEAFMVAAGSVLVAEAEYLSK